MWILNSLTSGNNQRSRSGMAPLPKNEHLANMCTSPNIKISTSNLHFWIKPKLNEHSKKVIFINFSYLVKTGNDHTSSEKDYPL